MFQGLPQPIEDILRVLEYWDHILAGFLTTMELYGGAIVMGFFLGLLLALLRQYGGFILSRIATGYIEFIRGTPLLAQLFFIYFLPYSMNAILEAQGLSPIPIGKWSFQTEIIILDRIITYTIFDHRMFVGLLTLGLNSAAYQAEYIRGAIKSVGTGQLLAAQSLGMSRLASIRHIVLPQALRRVIPAWSNEAAYLPKYTVVVFFIGVVDLFGKAHFIVANIFRTLTTYCIIALIFLALISIVSKVLDFVHKRTSIPGL